MPGRQDMPSTLRRSPKSAQDTWVKAHDSAVENYGEGERSHRTAFSALKHTHRKVGDRWEKKNGAGPSDRQARRRRPDRGGGGGTAGGVDANASKQELYQMAARLDIGGRSRMSKGELVKALQKASGRKTRQARG